MDARRGVIVVGASVAALVAGWFIRRWYLEREHTEELESSEKVRSFDSTMKDMNRPAKKTQRNTNGRHRVRAVRSSS